MAPRKKAARLQGSGSSRLPSMAVALYMKALDGSTDFSEQETWSTSFELAAADTGFRDEAGSSSSAGVGGGGLQGASSAPDEQAAALQLLGGQPALEPQVEGTRADRRKQREVTKQRRAAAVQELQQLRAWKQARAHTGGSVEGSSGKVAKMGNNGRKGKTNLHSKTHGSKEFYGSGDDKRDECADVAPSKPCSSGRADEKRIFVEYNRVEHAVYSWNARGVEPCRSLDGVTLSRTRLCSPCRRHSQRYHAREYLVAIRDSSRSQTLVGMPGSRRAQRLWQEFGRPWLPSGWERGHRQSLWSFGPLTVRQENSGAGPIKCWRRIRGQPLRRVKDVLYGASPRNSCIGGCRLLRWLHHCCPPVCLVISCARGPLLERALSRSFSGEREGDSEGPRDGEKGTNPVHRLGRGHLLPCAERFERRVEKVLKGYGRWGLRGPGSRRRTHPCVDGRQRQ